LWLFSTDILEIFGGPIAESATVPTAACFEFWGAATLLFSIRYTSSCAAVPRLSWTVKRTPYVPAASCKVTIGPERTNCTAAPSVVCPVTSHCQLAMVRPRGAWDLCPSAVTRCMSALDAPWLLGTSTWPRMVMRGVGIVIPAIQSLACCCVLRVCCCPDFACCGTALIGFACFLATCCC
jgi:hypothetical protein